VPTRIAVGDPAGAHPVKRSRAAINRISSRACYETQRGFATYTFQGSENANLQSLESRSQFYESTSYHYLAGYLKLERGEIEEAVEHLEKANPQDPFHRLLLARAYERKGEKEIARKTYEEVVASTANGIERALAYPEAKRKLATL
jgi:tetratricopeptide (TPR) repeat protein